MITKFEETLGKYHNNKKHTINGLNIFRQTMPSSGTHLLHIHLVGFWRKLWVIHYDNKNQGFTRFNTTKKHY
jgi:hypothetical protein